MRRISRLLSRSLPEPVKGWGKSVLYRLRNKRFKTYLKQKNVEGVVFDFWIADSDGRDWYDLQCTDPVWLEMRFLKEHMLAPGDVVLECGAHHGCTTIVLAHWVGNSGKILAFEALPQNCDIIEKNLKQNNLGNVILERKAVGAEKGSININMASNSSVAVAGPSVEVAMTALDVYEHLNPTFLKIDVEGFELEVLRGAKRILSTLPKFAIEIHTDLLSKYGASVDDLLSFIGVDNYKLWIQWDDGRYPEEYDGKTRITKRVHLFGIPHAK